MTMGVLDKLFVTVFRLHRIARSSTCMFIDLLLVCYLANTTCAITNIMTTLIFIILIIDWMVPVRNTHSIKGRPLGMRLLDLAIVKGLHESSNKNRRLLYSAPFRHHGPNNQTRIQMHARTLALSRIWNCTKLASVTPVVTSNQN